jgi:hypothetical protein
MSTGDAITSDILPQPPRLICGTVQAYDGADRQGIEQVFAARQETQETSCDRSALTCSCFANCVAQTDIRSSPQFSVYEVVQW